jgi:hypothetical protein
MRRQHGFSTELLPDQEHILRVAVFADNAATTTRTLVARVAAPEGTITLRLGEPAPENARAAPVMKGGRP